MFTTSTKTFEAALVYLSFVKGNLVMGIRQFCCQPSSKQLSWILLVRNGTIECIVIGGRRYSTDLLLQMP